MKRQKSWVFMIIMCILSLQLFAGGNGFAVQAMEEDKHPVEWDVDGLTDDEIYSRYAKELNDKEAVLSVKGENLHRLSVLRRFHPSDLELRIAFEDEESLQVMQVDNQLLFPDHVSRVVFTCGGQETTNNSDAVNSFQIHLWVCCPGALFNGEPIGNIAARIKAADRQHQASVFETYAKLYYLFDQVQAGNLQKAEGEPRYNGKLLFHIQDDVDITSQESLAYGEHFYDVPDRLLAGSFDEADTVIYIYPVRTSLGWYANEGEAIAVYTRVCVVDLHTMEQYEEYTAVSNDPPENLTIEVSAGEYSQNGAEGEYEPKIAVESILESDQLYPDVHGQNSSDQKAELTSDVTAARELLPWISDSAVTEGSEKLETASDPEAVTETETETETETQTNPSDLKEEQPKEVYVDQSVYSWLTWDGLDEIFDALDDNYRLMYDTLSTGLSLRSGSKGELAKGLQQTLVDFGQDIAVDGSIGNATLKALYTVEDAFSLPETANIGAREYALLMPALLYYQDPAKAGELLGRILDDPDQEGSLDLYFQACVLYLDEYRYHARELFEQSAYGDYRSRMLSCVLDLPETGVYYQNESFKGDRVTLTIEVNNPDTAAATCVQILNKKDELVAGLMVQGAGTVSVKLPEGYYRIYSGTGYRWFGSRDLFGDDGFYEAMLFEDGNDTIHFKDGFDYTLTFYVTEPQDSAMHVGSENLQWEELPVD